MKQYTINYVQVSEREFRQTLSKCLLDMFNGDRKRVCRECWKLYISDKWYHKKNFHILLGNRRFKAMEAQK